MAKTSNPDRQRRGDRGPREPKEFAETTLSIDRVTRVVKGGRRMRFRAVVIIGNRKGKVGLGLGKANEVQAAVQKAVKDARRHMVRIPLIKGTIPHAIEVKHKAAKIRLLPANEGTGIIAGGALRVILEHAGVKNVLSKRFGTGNKLVNAQASMIALGILSKVQVKGDDAANTDEALAAAAAAAAAAKDKPAVREISRDEAKKQQEINRRANIQDEPKEEKKAKKEEKAE